MSCASTPPHPHGLPAADDNAVHPEVLIANTLVLISAYAHCSCGNRRHIEGRIVDHLHALSTHAALSEGLRAITWQLAEQWAHAVRRTGQSDSLMAAASPTLQ